MGANPGRFAVNCRSLGDVTVIVSTGQRSIDPAGFTPVEKGLCTKEFCE